MHLTKTMCFLLLAVCFSCGPRSGIHEDKTEDGNFCGTQSESKFMGASYNDKGEKLFKQNCAVCHAAFSGQRLTGPGLKGLADRIPQPSEEWFVKYTLNNEKVFASGDPYSAKLKAQYKDAPMTVFEGILSEEDARDIYSFLSRSTQAIP